MILTSEMLLPLRSTDNVLIERCWSGPTPARISGEFSAVMGGGDGGTATLAVPDGAVVLTSLNVNEAEAKLIERALEVSNNNRTRAAELLGISVRTLRNKLNGAKADADGGTGE